jgi:hypothetical protein
VKKALIVKDGLNWAAPFMRSARLLRDYALGIGLDPRAGAARPEVRVDLGAKVRGHWK